jgi:hypothetical protein
MYVACGLEGRLVKCLFTVRFDTKDMTATLQDRHLIEEAHTPPKTLARGLQHASADFIVHYDINIEPWWVTKGRRISI